MHFFLQESLNKITVEARAPLLLAALAAPGREDVKVLASVLLRRLLSNEFATLQPKVSIIF